MGAERMVNERSARTSQKASMPWSIGSQGACAVAALVALPGLVLLLRDRGVSDALATVPPVLMIGAVGWGAGMASQARKLAGWPAGSEAGAFSAWLARGPRWLTLLFCLLGFGALSVSLGTDRNWDLKNYHLYAPYALLHGRMFFDIAPAQAQSFFNPTLHLPHQILFFALNNHPRVFAFIMGFPAGVLVFLVLRIAWEHATRLLPRGGMAWSLTLVAGLLAATGATVLPGVGLSSFDVLVAAPLALAYLLVLRATAVRDAGGVVRAWPLAVAGLSAGLIAGLKLTALPFAAAIGVMLLVTLGLRAAIIAGLAMIGGFLLSFGPFAWQLWVETGNPIFPYFNAVFRSPEWLPENTSDQRFLPRSMWQALAYPFWWIRPDVGLVGELRMGDARVALGYLSWFVLAVMLLFRPTIPGRRAILLILGVTALSYAAWAKMFGIYRYLVLVEVLAVVLVMLALLLAFRARPVVALVAFAGVSAATMATTVRPNWGHGPHGAHLLEAGPFPVTSGALVLSIGDEPTAYLIPLMPRDVRVLGMMNNLIRPGQDYGLNRRIDAAIAAQAGPIWTLTNPGSSQVVRDEILARHGLVVSGPCMLVRTSFEPGGHQFCPVSRAAARSPAPG